MHGFAEHSGRYEHVGRWFAEQKRFAVHAYDQLGHGRSSGVRCHVKRFDDYLEDLSRMLDRVRDEAPQQPLFLLGHSMGGLVAATFARERKPDLSGVILSAPPLGLGGTPRFRMWLARLIRIVAPRLSLDAGLDLNGLSTDPRVLEAYLADPLVERRMTASLAAELMKTVNRTGPGGAAVALPLIVLHGDADPICDARFSEAFAAAAPHARFVRYRGLRHEIMNEPSYAQVLEVIGWIEQQLGGRSRSGKLRAASRGEEGGPLHGLARPPESERA